MDKSFENKLKDIFKEIIIKTSDKGEEIKDKIQETAKEILTQDVNFSKFSKEKVKSFAYSAMEGVIQGAKNTKEKTEDLTRKAADGIIDAVRQTAEISKTKTRDYLKQAVSGIQDAINQAGDRVTDSAKHALENIIELKPKAQITFKCQAPKATNVYLVGSFNNWNPNATPMKKTQKGHWSVTLTLPYGTYQYRYLIDNQWFTDPETPQVANEFGSNNSVIVVGG